MAWVTPRTFVAAAVLTAAQLNETRDNLKALLPPDAVAWTTWTPTLTQSATPTKTVTYAKWTQLAKQVTFMMYLDVTGNGTAANAIVVGLPTAGAVGGGAFLPTFGNASLFDVSAGQWFGITCRFASTTTFNIQSGTDTNGRALIGATGAAFAGALASGDIIMASGSYEAA
jgi:hypothetical protein